MLQCKGDSDVSRWCLTWLLTTPENKAGLWTLDLLYSGVRINTTCEMQFAGRLRFRPCTYNVVHNVLQDVFYDL